jgi:hypothetical protein
METNICFIQMCPRNPSAIGSMTLVLLYIIEKETKDDIDIFIVISIMMIFQLVSNL